MQLIKLSDGKKDSRDKEELIRMMYHMNQVIYSSRNYTYLSNGYGTVNYYFMLIFQPFQYLLDEMIGEDDIRDSENREYFRKLSGIFFSVEQNMNQSDNGELIEKIKSFSRTENLASKRAREGMNGILELLCFALSKITEIKMNRTEKEWKIPDVSHRVKKQPFGY